MKKSDYIKYWKELAEHDFDIALTLLKSKKYDACLFFGHLTLEKISKAFWVRDNEDSVPPFSHNLVLLLEQTRIKLEQKEKKMLVKINEFNIQTRYPDYKSSFYKLCTKEFTGEHFSKIKGLYKWLQE